MLLLYLIIYSCQPGDLHTIEDLCEVIVFGSFPGGDIRVYHDTPEIFRFQVVIIICLDKYANHRTTLFKIYFDRIFSQVAGFNKFGNHIIRHTGNFGEGSFFMRGRLFLFLFRL